MSKETCKEVDGIKCVEMSNKWMSKKSKWSRCSSNREIGTCIGLAISWIYLALFCSVKEDKALTGKTLTGKTLTDTSRISTDNKIHPLTFNLYNSPQTRMESLIVLCSGATAIAAIR